MNTEQIREIIHKRIYGQGTCVDASSALPVILNAICDLLEQGGGGGTSNYNDLSNKPDLNGITLRKGMTYETLDLYNRRQVNDLLDEKGEAEFVDALPSVLERSVWYYTKKFADGTDVPDDKRALYIVDKNDTLEYMGVVGDTDLTNFYTKTETDDMLDEKQDALTSTDETSDLTDSSVFSEVNTVAKTNKRWTFAKIWDWITGKIKTVISSSLTDSDIVSGKAVFEELSEKVIKYGYQVNIETAVDDTTLWNALAQIGADDKKTDSSMVFNAGTCYLTHLVSPTKTAKIFQFIVTGGVSASSINKRITLILSNTGEVFTKTMDDGVWQPWKGGKKYKHTLVRYNNDSFEYPMGWFSIINDKKTMTYNDFRDWLIEKGYDSAINSYYWCGGCCGTTGVRNKEDAGTAYIGRVVSGVFYDGTNMFFKYDYNGTVTIPSSRCKVITDELG